MTLVFVQKVLTVLPPLELFSLEEKAALLPGGLFVASIRSANPRIKRCPSDYLALSIGTSFHSWKCQPWNHRTIVEAIRVSDEQAIAHQRGGDELNP